MYCGFCGNDNNEVLVTEYKQNGNIIEAYYYGKCSKCNELLGEVKIFKSTNWDYISREDIKKVLKEHKLI